MSNTTSNNAFLPIIDVTHGGTNANNAADARTNLSINSLPDRVSAIKYRSQFGWQPVVSGDFSSSNWGIAAPSVAGLNIREIVGGHLFMQYQDGGNAGNAAYVTQSTAYKSSSPYLYFYNLCRPKTDASTRTFRHFIGMAYGNPVSSDTPTECVGFFVSTGLSHTNWQCLTASATSQGFSDSGVAYLKDTNYELEITYDGITATYWINDTQVATRTTVLPTANTDLSMSNRWVNISGGGAHIVDIGRFYGEFE